jgi:hypothetical protein
MDTLQTIWSSSIEDIDAFISLFNINLLNLSEINKYIFVSEKQMEENVLPDLEIELTKYGMFSRVMKDTD